MREQTSDGEQLSDMDVDDVNADDSDCVKVNMMKKVICQVKLDNFIRAEME